MIARARCGLSSIWRCGSASRSRAGRLHDPRPHAREQRVHARPEGVCGGDQSHEGRLRGHRDRMGPEADPRARRTPGWRARGPGCEGMARPLMPHAALVIAAGPGHCDYLGSMTNVRIAIVTNSKPLASGGYEPPKTDRMTVAYYGGLDVTRLLVPLAELAAEDDSFVVEIGGDGPLAEPIRSLAARSRGNLRYLGLLRMVEVLPRTRACDVVFSVFDPAYRLNRIGVPNKFFEALVAGRPILVSRGTWGGSEGEAAQWGVAV